MADLLFAIPHLIYFIGLLGWILGILYIFGLRKTMPRWLRITAGIVQIPFIIFVVLKYLNSAYTCVGAGFVYM